MISGQIGALSVFKILRSIDGKGMTGTLTLRQDMLVKRFSFFKGVLRFSYSNLEQEHLAYRLRELGLLSSIEVQEISTSDSYNSEALLNRILEEGLVKARRLSRIESMLSRERLLQSFEWSRGAYEFSEQMTTSELPELSLDLTAVLVEAAFIRTPFPVCERFIRSMDSRQTLKRKGVASPSVEQAIRDTWVFRQSVEGVTLDAILSDSANLHLNVRAAAAMILAGIGHLIMTEGVSTEPRPTSEETKSPKVDKQSNREVSAVLGSREINLSESQSEAENGASSTEGRRVVLRASNGSTEQARQPTPKAKPRTTQKAAEPRATSRRPKRHTPPPAPIPNRNEAKPTKKGPRQREDILAELSEEMLQTMSELPDSERSRLLDARRLIANSKKMNHYEVLGVSREASPESVRETFRRLAREYHADRFSRYNLSDSVHQLIQLTFVTINASNEILGDPERRKEYDLELSLAGRVSSPAKSVGERRAPQELDRALSAERELKGALSCLSRGEAKGASTRLSKAFELGLEGELPDTLNEYIRYLLHLDTGSASPKAVKKKALDALLQFVSSNTSYPELFLYIGRIYKRDNDFKRALAAFKKATEMAPHLAEASSELRYLKRQMETQGKGLRGMLRK